MSYRGSGNVESKEWLFKLINYYVVEKKYSLTDFQQDVLDYTDIKSSIEYGENDKEVQMEIWKDNVEEDFYLIIDNKGNIIKSYI